MYLHDILTAIPWGLLLAFSIGPGFFVLLETSITKGFRAAFVFDLGIVFGDIIFILIAYLSTNQLLEQLKDNPTLFVIGGIIMLAYGLISFIMLKRNFQKQQVIEYYIEKQQNQSQKFSLAEKLEAPCEGGPNI